MNVPFFKYQSIGNDFVLFEAESVFDYDLPTLAIEACERKFGIGADGMLVIDRLTPNRLELKMYNGDGTEDFCGNGLRCSIQHAHSHMGADSNVDVEHLGRLVKGFIHDTGSISTVLPAASFDPADVPADYSQEIFEQSLTVEGTELHITSVSTGSTHTIIFVKELPDDDFFFPISKALEVHPLFPERTSVIWTRVDSARKLTLRIWERGVGETLGCGTGSTAAAVVTMRRDNHGGPIEVVNPGGTLIVEAESWAKDMLVTGEAKLVYGGAKILRLAPEQVTFPSPVGV